MKRFALSLFKTNSELVNFIRTTSNLRNIQARRAAIKIAVIDDQPFIPQTNLKSFGYEVIPIGDVKNVSEIKDYHMVLCDIMGVGRHFDAKAQGATIISEIKKNYPEKVVIAYTGGSLGDPAVKSAKSRADDMIRKDVDTEEWIAKLDERGAEAVDPYVMWNKVRRRFIELQVDTKSILILEDAFVRSVLNRESDLYTLRYITSSIPLGQDVRAILQGLASATIFAAIVSHP